MRVVVDFDLCESNAVCMGIAPEVFEVRDDDFLYILQEEPPEALRPKIEEAVQRCPEAGDQHRRRPPPVQVEQRPRRRRLRLRGCTRRTPSAKRAMTVD